MTLTPLHPSESTPRNPQVWLGWPACATTAALIAVAALLAAAPAQAQNVPNLSIERISGESSFNAGSAAFFRLRVRGFRTESLFRDAHGISVRVTPDYEGRDSPPGAHTGKIASSEVFGLVRAIEASGSGRDNRFWNMKTVNLGDERLHSIGPVILRISVESTSSGLPHPVIATSNICLVINRSDGTPGEPCTSGQVGGSSELSVEDAEATEGDDAALDFAVTLSPSTTETVTVDYATSDGTATAGDDYTHTSGTLTFSPGVNRRTVSVPVIDDSHEDGGETLTLTLSSPTGPAHLGDATATGTINNDEAEEEPTVALTGEFRGVPTEHGDEEFEVELHFSETLSDSFSYRTLENVVSVSNGNLVGVRRLQRQGDQRNKQWGIRIEPQAGKDVSVNVPATTDCSAADALCTEDDRPLSPGVATTIAAPAPPESRPDLTVSFTSGHEPPATHDGSSAFKFRIEFSEDPHQYSYKTLRDHTLEIRQANRIRPEVRRVISGGDQHWEVTVTPNSTADMTIRVHDTTNCNHTGAVCTQDGRMLSNELNTTVTGPAGFSVEDARVSEGPGAALGFVVSLSRSSTTTETVDYETRDGSAQAGVDYTATSGTLTFDAGETSKTVSVAILDDSHDEGEETLTLRLTNASTGAITDNAATGTIENHDPLPRALMARFGRSAAIHVVDQIEERLTAPRSPGFDGRVAGYDLRQQIDGNAALQLLSQLTGAGTFPMGHGQQTATPAAGGMTPRAGMPRTLGNVNGSLGGQTAFGMAPLGSTTGMMPGQDMAGGSGSGFFDLGMQGDGLITDSQFALNRQTRDGGMLSFWSRGAQSSFAGQEGDLGLDGNVRTTMFGADYSKGPLIVGLSLANSRGAGSYVGVDLGAITSSVTGLYPWIGFRATERITVWSAGGYGVGGLRLAPDIGAPLESRLSMTMAATGTRGELVTADNGFALAFKADALWVGTAVDGVDDGRAGRLAATTAAINRYRTGLEGSRDYTFAGRVSLKTIVEAGIRQDGGDAETGTGMDVGGGVVLADSRTGLAVDLRVRTLVLHQAEGFRERGLSMSLRYNPRPSTPLGLHAQVTPAWGGEARGADALWHQESMGGFGYGRQAQGNRLDAEVGYGQPVGSRFSGTPRVAVRASEYGNEYRVGYDLALLERATTSFNLNLDLHQREMPMLGDTNRGFVGRASLGW